MRKDPSRLADSVRNALETAANADEVAAAVARVIWLRDHGDACPKEFVPSAQALADWLFTPAAMDPEDLARSQASLNSSEALSALLGGNWNWRSPEENGEPLEAEKEQPLRAVSEPGELQCETLEDIHQRWLKAPRKPDGSRLMHPLSPLVRAWQALPQRMHPDQRNNAIMPHSLSGIRDIRELPGNWQIPESTGPVAGDDWPELGLEPVEEVAALIPALPLVLFDASGGVSTSRGRGAALSLRLFLEIVMAVPTHARGSRVELAIPMHDLIPWLWPTEPGKASAYRPARQGAMLREAIETLNRIAVPVAGRHGPQYPNFWSCVLVRKRPGYLGIDSSDELLLDVRLPKGSGKGPLVHRPTLRRWGVRSAPAYRAALGLAYFWNRHLTATGRRFPPLVPEVRRNQRGYLLGPTGEILLDKNGKPTKHWSDRRALHTGRFLRNPEMNRLPWLLPKDVLMLCAPETATSNPATRRHILHKARKALDAMETAGDLRVERCPFSRSTGPVRILPPDWWGQREGNPSRTIS